MDRQPLILALLLLSACGDDEEGPDWFDGPVGAAVLTPDQGGPYEEPVGFVGNARSGTIVPLDLKHATLLSDQPAAPYLMPRQIATGDARQLDEIAVWANDADDVILYAADLTNQVLVEAPYLVGGERVEPTSTDPVFVDADASGDAPALTDVDLRVGWTTTEDWTVTYDGQDWIVSGTRSGIQSKSPELGEEYCSDRRELCFVLTGEATEGDLFQISTDAGIVEHDLLGNLLDLKRVGDVLVAAVWDGASGALVVWDPATDQEDGRLDLGLGAEPTRLALSPDGSTIYVGDGATPRVTVVDLATLTVTETLVPAAPVTALTVAPTGLGDRLYVGLADLNRLDAYDLETGAWLDANPLDDETAGVSLHSPIIGVAATPEPIKFQQETAFGGREDGPAVAVTTFDGALLLVDAETGCVVPDYSGPRLQTYSNRDAVEFNDYGAPSNPAVLADDATGRAVVVNPCGGVAQEESWTVTYDEAAGDWIVEGSRSGVQVGRAVTDQRYVSDHAEVSFTLVGGTLPETDGDTFDFSVDEGVLRMVELPSGSSTSIAMSLPSTPLIFQYDAGNTGGGWDELDRRTYALLPVTHADRVARVRLSSWTVEVIWN